MLLTFEMNILLHFKGMFYNISCLLISFNFPKAINCATRFPIAVASIGPACTSLLVTFAINWLSNSFCEPPPMTLILPNSLSNISSISATASYSYLQGCQKYILPFLRDFLGLVDLFLCNILNFFNHIFRL